MSAPDPSSVDGAVSAPVEMVHGCPVTTSRGQRVVHVDRGRIVEVVRAMYADGFEICVDLTGVDYLGAPARALPDGVVAERFEVVVNLLSISRGERLRLRVQVPESDPTVPSLFEVHPGTEAHERVQRHECDALAAWIHAVLHKIEGDDANARHWYRCAGRLAHAGDAPEAELRAIRAVVAAG